MVRIKSVSTSGLKSIEDFEFDAKGINNIIRSNNCKKASLLKSIYTAYSPGYINSSGENEWYLVQQAVVKTASLQPEEEIEEAGTDASPVES